MQYMILVYEPATDDEEARAARMRAVGAKHMELAKELRAAGIQKDGSGLQGITTATTIKTIDGVQTMHDGPFAETREHLAGYYLIEVADLDAALAVAKRVPVGDGGMVEVRPLMQH
ncbi:MAG: YciI family protein [Phenylobacterium sp.]